MKRNYDECVTKYSDSFVRVVLDPGYVSRIQNFVTELVEAKSKEDHHKIDSNKEVKRFTTGFLGEAALEKLFGIPIIDWTIGYSGLYHIPDIPGYRVGIKTVERDKFPIIFKDNSYPQIICIKSTKYNNLIFVCGLATSNVLNKGFYDTLDKLVETKAPNGYVTSEKNWDVTLSYADQETEIVTKDVSVTNTPNEVKIKKVAADSQEALAGVEFQVWKKGTSAKDNLFDLYYADKPLFL